MKTFALRILAADRPFFEGECVSLRVQLSDGQYGVLADHAPAVAAIVPGTIRYQLPDGSAETAYASEGILKIENNDVLVLATTVERPEEIDENRALRSAEAAREELMRKLTAQEYKEAEARLARAMGRLKVRGRSLDMD